MITPDVAQLIAADRSAQLQRAATSARLAALARCCQPSHWANGARRAGQALTGWRTRLRRDAVRGTGCCAPA